VEQVRAEGLTSRTNEGVPGDKLHVEPRYGATGVDGVEPERDLGELNRDRIEVDTIDVIGGNEGLDLLKFLPVLVMPQALIGFNLPGFEIRVSKLVDRLVEKGAATHGRLTNRQLEDVVRGFVLQQFLQCILDHTLGQDFRRVIAGGLLTVAARQAVNEGAARVVF
jgi:hypothetical protein